MENFNLFFKVQLMCYLVPKVLIVYVSILNSIFLCFNPWVLRDEKKKSTKHGKREEDVCCAYLTTKKNQCWCQ